MPLPVPELLTLPEAAAYVSARCAVTQAEAEVALDRAIRVDRKLCLFEALGKSLSDYEFEGMRINWRAGSVDTRVPGDYWISRHLLVARCEIDDWIPKAARRGIDHESNKPGQPDIAGKTPDLRNKVPRQEVFATAVEIVKSAEFQSGEGVRSERLQVALRTHYPHMNSRTLERYSSGAPKEAAKGNVVRLPTKRGGR
jgi:hypothetical protein